MDQSKFDIINQEYTKRRSRLLVSGRYQRPTSLGYWATSNPVHLFELFKKLNLEKHKSFVDLGSGDGIVVAVASLFTKAAGIEVDKELHKDALEMRQKLKLNYTIQNKDYLEEDLSQYDMIFINPDNYFYRLEKNLVEQFKGTLIVTDNVFQPLSLSLQKKVSVKGTGYSIYSL